MSEKIDNKTIDIVTITLNNLRHIIGEDRKSVFYLIYYAILEAVLLLVSPLTSAIIINSVLAHATISIYTLSFIVIIIFIGIAVLQILKQYIVEKFEQKIFVQQAIETAQDLSRLKEDSEDKGLDKYMNYFFDIISIQKLFPNLLLSGSSLALKLLVSLLLLLIFDTHMFQCKRRAT